MELIKACRYGDVEACRQLCSADSFSHTTADGALSPLHWAVLAKGTSDEDCVSIIEILKGSNVNHKANDVVLSGSSHLEKVSSVVPLHLAVLHKGAAVVKKLLAMGGNPDQQDSNGETSLMYACRGENADIVRTLLDNGSDATICSGSGESPFSVCSDENIRALVRDRLNAKLVKRLTTHGDVDQIESLLKAKADVNGTDGHGVSALLLSIRTGDFETVLQMLEVDGIDASATVPATSSNALHELVSSSMPGPEKEDIANELIFMKVDINHKNTDGKTPLDLSVITHQNGLARLLLDNGGEGSELPSRSRTGTPTEHKTGLDPFSPTDSSAGIEPQSPQIQFTQSQAARDDGLMIDLTEVAGRVGSLLAELQGARTSVDSMSMESLPQVEAQLVLHTEADLVAQKGELLHKLNMYLSEFERVKANRNKDFKTIGTFIELQKLISDCRKDIGVINERIENGDFSTTAAPVTDTGVRAPSGWFRSPDSIEADIEGCVRMIRKSTSSSTGVDSAIYELLKRAQSSEAVPVLKLLRNRGSDVNFRDKETGKTTLIIACDASHPCEEVIEWLLANSADVTLVDKPNGWTCLHYAVCRGHRKVCEAIIERGKIGMVNVRDKAGKSVVDYCTNAAIMKILTPVEPAQSS